MSMKRGMEQCRNDEAGETGDPRENLPISAIVRHDSLLQKSGSDPGRGLNPVRFEQYGRLPLVPPPLPPFLVGVPWVEEYRVTGLSLAGELLRILTTRSQPWGVLSFDILFARSNNSLLHSTYPSSSSFSYSSSFLFARETSLRRRSLSLRLQDIMSTALVSYVLGVGNSFSLPPLTPSNPYQPSPHFNTPA
ncbi:hypothetical protein PR048_008236 [Dryococelus australis]|uniref:Uncharacterized protein n=1 Tax=Dryococelus australis TaxID=614101 RepID=A0ABQ9HXD0_9NEOP|nr:hypothetical protein PR048_008236 [Dryococelus australis]